MVSHDQTSAANAVKISAVVITLNEENKIERCLDSLVPVIDELVVIDSFSTDKTREICLSKGAVVIGNTFIDFVTQKRFAVAQAQYDVILSLDADEYLSEELAESIRAAKANWTADAYIIDRLNSYAGRWIRSSGWYPDRKIRLWDRRRGNWEGEKVHEVVKLTPGAKTGALIGDLLHESYQEASELIKKGQLLYAGFYAEQNAFKKSVTPFQIFTKMIVAFFRSYILRKGFTEGYEGMLISMSTANATFYKYIMLYERMRMLKTSLIVAVRNATNLEIALQRLKQQTMLPDEIIISIDDVEMEKVAKTADALLSKPVTIMFNKEPNNDEHENNIIARTRHDFVIWIAHESDLSDRRIIERHRKSLKRNSVIVRTKGRPLNAQMVSFWRQDAHNTSGVRPFALDHLKKSNTNFFLLSRKFWGYSLDKLRLS